MNQPLPSDAAPGPGEITLIGMLNLVLRNRRTIVALAAVGFLMMVIPTLVSPRNYTSRGSFVLASRQAKSGLAALAAQYGVQMSADEPSQNPNFYVDLIRSHQILTELAKSPFPASTGAATGSATLTDRLEVTGSTPAVRAERAFEKLRTSVQASAVSKTGVVNFSVATKEPKLSAQVATRLLEIVNQFNVATRQSQAASERKFTEQRLGEVRVALRQAEDRMVEFLQRNRMAFTAELQYSIDRLQREVQQQHGLYGTLQSAHEQARIDEVRDTPLLTIIDVPVAPIKPDSRALVAKGILGIIIGALLGIMMGVAREQFGTRGATRTGREFEEFAALRSETLREVRGLRQVFSRGGSKSAPKDRPDVMH